MMTFALILRVGLGVLFFAVNAVVIADTQRMNVVFIISDDLTANALGCYGNEQVKTPHIDGLAAQGVRFTKAYCQFPVCGPARASLMSGMYPQSIGVTGNGRSAQFTKNLGDRPSMAGVFRNAGWFTARVSKIYHMRVPGDITAGVDGPDHIPSWTERYNCKGPEWMTEGVHSHLSNERLQRTPDKHYGLGFGTAFYVVKGSSDGAEQADRKAAAKAVELLEAHRDEPFFLAVGLVRPHVPLVAPAPYYDDYPYADMTLPESVENDWSDIPKAGISKNSKSTGLDGDTPGKQKVLSAYYASVGFMDTQVGRVLAALDRLGLRERTIVVFTSDHGYHLGEHEFWQKLSLHEESARIPLIIAAPGRAPAVTHSLAEAIDLYPTLADAAGLAVPSHCQGKSLVPVLADPSATVREDAYCHRGNAHLLRTSDWAYIEYRDGAAELYNMQKDPLQFTNLAGQADYADTLSRMKTRLAKRLAAMK